MKSISLMLSLLTLLSAPAYAQEAVSTTPPEPQQAPTAEVTLVSYPRLHAVAELGSLAVLDHKIQFSQNNTLFDYRSDGGQDTLFPATKLSLDFEFDPHHSLTFLYQPLSLTSQAVLRSDLRQDNVTFAQGTPMKFLYDFPFFRLSYLYDFNTDPFEELAAGVSLQMRDAVIEFESLKGDQLVSQRDVGPVPVLKFRSRHRLNDTWWWGSEVDGFYAPIRYLNGGTTDVIGAILDANLRIGAVLDDQDKFAPYLNLRYLGGGGVGTSRDPGSPTGDGYVNNWLHFFILSVGIRTSLF